MDEPALQIERLSVAYHTEQGSLPAVRDVSLTVHNRQALGLVGESGSGKTTLALGSIGYLPPGGEATTGTVRLAGTEFPSLTRKHMRQTWGSRVGLISQDPQGAFNPSLTMGQQLDEMGRRHLALGRHAARETTLELLTQVGLPDARSVAERYPHQLSGGMLQRAAIAMALITGPELLILDEPTTSLDVTTQALILDLLRELQQRANTAMLYITHNLGVVRQVCDRVAVMYSGSIVEQGPTAELFNRPLHPYTANLLRCVPRFGDSAKDSLASIPGELPRLDDLPGGCTFAPRCPLALESCRKTEPPAVEVSDGRWSSCLRWQTLLTQKGQQEALTLPAIEAVATSAALERATPAADDALGAIVPAVADAGAGTEKPSSHLVELESAVKHFTQRRSRRVTKAVDGVSVSIDRASTLGLVGESGSGKTTLARVLAGLTKPTAGRVLLEGEPLPPDIAKRSKDVLRHLQMVFQNPESSLNPRRTVGRAIVQPLRTLGRMDRESAKRRAVELLSAVRLPSTYFHRYPGELSGGEKQRVAIARAFAAAPDLIICDEPVSSLDVSVQGSLMNLLIDLQAQNGTSYLLISHDLAAVQHLSHRIAVMYMGTLMEQGDASRVLTPPYHPYTEALLSAVPRIDADTVGARVRLDAGQPPSGETPTGCRFHPRCPRSLGKLCETETPPWRVAAAGKTTGSESVASATEAVAGAETEAAAAVAATAEHAVCCHISLDTLAALQADSAREGDRP